MSDEAVSPQRRDTLAVVARKYANGTRHIETRLFNFIDSVYRQVLFITFACCHHDIGDKNEWTALPQQEFLAYFRDNVPEEGKEFLREKFRDEPRSKNRATMREFAAMTDHFHHIFGLGDVPKWASTTSMKYAKAIPIPFIGRRISIAMNEPRKRAAHLAAIGTGYRVAEAGGWAMHAAGDFEGFRELFIQEFTRGTPAERLTAA